MTALLFDLDGTLLDSDRLHAPVFIELLAEHGVEIDEDTYRERISGRLNADIFADFLPGGDSAALSDEKEARFRDRLGRDAEPMPGLVALLDRAETRGWRLGVVTNAPAENAHAMLGALDLGDRFETLVIADELPRGKPDPLPYATGLDRLETRAEDALAFEDSPSGIASAAAAGIATLGVRSSQTHDRLIEAGASDTLADFTDPALSGWLDRLSQETP